MSLNITALNFLEIKENLKNHMRDNPAFSDYDYEGSGLSFLFDTLAYNTHYNAVMASFMANEMFLDTAIKRESVVSHAKALGYHPRSSRAAKAYINIEIATVSLAIGQSAPDVFIIRRGTAFSTTIENTPYQFITTKDVSATRDGNGKYVFQNVEIAEGIFATYSWVVDDISSSYDKYVIPNPKVDTSLISMKVYEDASAISGESWSNSSTLFSINENSEVFFTQEGEGEKTEIYFGDGIVGKKPSVGNVVRVEYISTNGASGNGAKVFGVSTSILHNGSSDVIADRVSISLYTPNSYSMGGQAPESIEEIKYNATNHFAAQNRAVTSNDYASLIKANFPNIKAVKVWGGEDNIPPKFKTVCLCVVPTVGEYLTSYERTRLIEFIKEKSIMDIRADIVNPEYLYLNINTVVKFNPLKLSSGVDITAAVKNTIINFNEVNLQTLNAPFKHSRLVTAIDNSNIAVSNNVTDVIMYKTLVPNLGIPKTYLVNYLNALDPSEILSTEFTTSLTPKKVHIRSRGNKLLLGYLVEGNFVIVKDIGTVDRSLGILSINSLNIVSYEGNHIKVFAAPSGKNIEAVQFNVLKILPEDISITTQEYNK